MLLPRRFLASAALATVATVSPALADMTLSLPSAPDGKLPASQVLSGFGCDGANLSPQLTWNGAPPDTGSFVITIHDPDAPTGSGLWHWSVFNVSNSVTELPEGAGSGAEALPPGSVTARNDFSSNKYDGACPPEGTTHRYVVTVFAMPRETLPLDATASAAMVGFFANTASLARASVVVTYGR